MKHRKLMVVALLLGLVLPAWSPPAKPEKPPRSQYLRFQKGKAEDALQVAITSFKDPKTNVQVDLVGVIHIGARGYYRKLNKLFEEYDAVLYEMVGDPKRLKQKPDPRRKESSVSTIQRWMKDVLELEFQLDHINYRRDHFIHADMKPREFDKAMKDRGESLLQLMWKMMQQDMARQRRGERVPQISPLELFAAFFSPNRGLEMKRLLARNMGELEATMNALEAGDGTVIITERNKVAIKVLRKSLETPANKRLAIFYGAGHMPDLEQRLLTEFGMKKGKTTWLTAWNLPKK